MGLVPNLRHDSNGNRLFDEESLHWLQGAKFLRASGLSIPEIRHYFALCQEGNSPLRERQEILIRLKEASQKERDAMQARIDCLSDKIAQFQDTIDTDGFDNCNPLNW